VRIGIDASCWQNHRGFGRFTRELVRELVHGYASAHEFILFADRTTALEGDFPAGARVEAVETRRQPIRAASATGWRSPLDLVRLGWRAARCRTDVFLFPAVYSFYPILGRVPVVTVFHDAMTERRPELFFPTPRARLFWRAKVWLARRQSARIVTPSESARREVAAALRWPVESIRRIDEAPAGAFTRRDPTSSDQTVLSRYSLPREVPLILYVGGISPHKNLDGLLRALSSVRPRDPAGWHLALVGEYERSSYLGCHEEIARISDELGLVDRVTFTGFVPDEDLAALYGAATLLVLPSLEEGFGLPVVEAMACGLPVAASARGSLPEVVGGAGLIFDPLDDAAMAGTIARLLEDPGLRRELSENGLARAGSFSWRESARTMMDVLEETAAGNASAHSVRRS
jgi:glycosyltransferase involved in cell wall biosynthesis